MILGTLSLIQKRGLFYKEILLESEDRFSDLESKALTESVTNPINDNPETFTIIPVNESGNTDYIRAIFEDEGKAQYPYEVTVWLLIEESIMDI